MKGPDRLLLVISLLSFPFVPTQGSAQQATSFEQLQVLVQKGDQVSVTGTDGEVTKGRVEDISASSLRLMRERMTIELPEAKVFEIKKKDPLGNGAKTGALLGMGVGGGFGILGALFVCGELDCAPEALAGVALSAGFGAGFGAGIGVAIDAITNRHPIVYRARTGGPSARVSLRPLLSTERKGIVLRVSF